MYSVLHSVLIFHTTSSPLTLDVKNWFRQTRTSARWGSFHPRKFANSRFQRSFRFSDVPHPTLLIFVTRFSPLTFDVKNWSRHKWISPGVGSLGSISKNAWRYFPRVALESESIPLKLNIWHCIVSPVYFGYRIYSINRPERLLYLWTLRVGSYLRWALIRGWALIKYSPFLASAVCLFCNKTVNGNNKTRRCNKARFL